MMLPLRFSEAASGDVITTSERYRSVRAGLDLAFISELEEHLAIIRSFPKGAPSISKRLRQMPLKRFPYVIVFSLSGEWLTIQRVVHTSRKRRVRFLRR